MPTQLDPVEARALGALVEKSLTTPDQYPLTFNALLNACNQKTSRDPVMTLDPDALGRAVQSLIGKDLAVRLTIPGTRVPKFRHSAENLFPQSGPNELGVICVLLLRGPQTPGELKGRTDRLCDFQGTADVEALLQGLCARPEPIVARLPRQPGQKETRYQHLFSGPAPAASGEPAAAQPSAAPDRLAQLEKRVEVLETAVKTLEERLTPKTSL
ncbi:MAG: YceH family protein [Elusimicrobiota bacterium]